jgi:hypothetical protein
MGAVQAELFSTLASLGEQIPPKPEHESFGIFSWRFRICASDRPKLYDTVKSKFEK